MDRVRRVNARLSWAPRRAELPGLALAASIGGAALAMVHALPASPLVSDVLVALLLGAIAVNTPLRPLLGLRPVDGAGDRHGPGLNYVGKRVLRTAIVLMGMKVQAAFFGLSELTLIVGVGAAAISSAFFVTHGCASRLGLRRPMADLLAAGTMICGASAVNAVAPVVRARRDEQGVAIGATFLFSVVALLTFRPLALALQVDAVHAGLWSGLAVNDLSSAVAVGKQMGDQGGALAAAAKSMRVLMLAPTLLAFAFLRRERTARADAALAAHLPTFLVGYLGLAVARAAGDRFFGASALWPLVLRVDTWTVNLLMASVAAAIGLNLEIASLLEVGWRAVLTAAAASAWMAGLSLAMIMLCLHRACSSAALLGVAAVVASLAIYGLGRRAPEGSDPAGKRLTDIFSNNNNSFPWAPAAGAGEAKGGSE